MPVTIRDLKTLRESALTVHNVWKQEIALSDKVATDRWEILWPDGSTEMSDPLVENIYSQALEDKTLSAGAELPSLFTMPTRGTRKDRGEVNAQKRKRVMLSYWERSQLRRNLKRFYSDWFHTGAAYGIPWTDWNAPVANRLPYFLKINPRTVFPLGHNSQGQLTSGLIMRQRRVSDMVSDWPDNPTLQSLISDHETRGERAEFFEEIWYFDESEWAVAVGDSLLPAHWQGAPWVPGEIGAADSLILDWLTSPVEHGMVGCPLKEARRVTVDDRPRGALVDTIPGLKVAQNFMAAVLDDLQASVYAPVVLENIENDEEYGLGAVLVGDGTGTAQVKRDRPPVNFEAQQTIADIIERARNQAFEPAQRGGEAGASIVSAKGTMALMGAFNAELAAAQFDVETLLQELTSTTANFDEVWCPGSKHIWGIDDNSKPFDETYNPETVFSGDYRVKVTYGEKSGLDRQNHLIQLSTLRNLGALSLRTFMEKAGVTEDPLQEERDMAIENLTNLFYQQLLPQRIQSGDLQALQNFVRKFDDDDMTVRAAVMETIEELTDVGPLEGNGQQGGSRADILRMSRSLDRGGIPGSAAGQPPSQIEQGPAFAPAVRRGLQQASPGGN